jgi:MFS transporter, MHS family, alpha-ketoglutarate permease
MIGLQNLLTEEQMYAWGWRIPFVFGAVAGVGIMWLRRGMDESTHYERESARDATGRKTSTGLKALIRYPKQLATVFGLAIGGTVAFYVYTSYMQKYMVNTSGISKEDAALISFIALFLFMFLQPIAGAISDRIGRRKVMLFFSLGAGVATVPLMTALGNTSNVFVAFALMMTGLVFVTGYTALSAIIKAELFPTNVRALGVGLPHALVAAAFGGTAEPVALALKQAGVESMFFWYVTGCIALTFLAALVVKEPSKGSHLESERAPEAQASDQGAVPVASPARAAEPVGAVAQGRTPGH